MMRLGRIVPILLVVVRPAYGIDVEGTRHQHLGPAACASSVCHGKIAAQPDRNVGLNEYRTWLQVDRHSRAYQALTSTPAKQMAGKLGLGSPTGEKTCLACHADNVPETQRGPKFQITDGVGCESCHGGAEKWIESHASLDASHQQNVANGMYPTEKPLKRAQLCLTCHLGTKDQFATHLIMAAGHPRLRFELDAFTVNQPAHFSVDADYRRRKGNIDGINLWLTGQIESARFLLQVVKSEVFRPPGALFPELALYDCNSCHHPFDQPRWTPARSAAGARPGALRVQTQSLVVLQAVMQAIDPDALPQLVTLTSDLVRAGQRNADAVKGAAEALLLWLGAHEDLIHHKFSHDEVAAVRRALVTTAAEDKASDYATAEQVVAGIESLSYVLGDRAANKAALDSLFKAVKSGTRFLPSEFAAAANNTLKRF